MTSPVEKLLEHASKAQAAVEAQRKSAADIAAAATRARDEARAQAAAGLASAAPVSPQQGGQPS